MKNNGFFEYETQNKTINNSLGNVLNPFKERFAKNPVLWSGLTVDRAVSHYQELYALGTLSAAHFELKFARTVQTVKLLKQIFQFLILQTKLLG